jgi:hypothetical protein
MIFNEFVETPLYLSEPPTHDAQPIHITGRRLGDWRLPGPRRDREVLPVPEDIVRRLGVPPPYNGYPPPPDFTPPPPFSLIGRLKL